MKVTLIGTGFVGVVSAAVFASHGNQVTGLDIDPKKVASLEQGKVPFFEPGLEKLLIDQQQAGNLRFTTDYAAAISEAEVVIVAVGTPSAPDGQADLKFVFAACESAAPYLAENAILVIKSTVPPGTIDVVRERISPLLKNHITFASLPEFLKEGTAVQDTLHPDRIIIGADDGAAIQKLKALHQPFAAPMIVMKPASAQMAKYAANSYLATRITFINEIANLCQKTGADIQEVIAGISDDKRIGKHYWYPGLGYGGSCFPKDVGELAAYSRSVGDSDNLFNQLHRINTSRIPMLFSQYEKIVGGWANKKVAVLGLSFKPQTNDMREAPSTKIIPLLAAANAQVFGYDPKAVPDVGAFIPALPNVTYTSSLNDAVKDADVILAVIEWPEIIGFDFTATKENKTQWFIDARNQFDQQQLQTAGYQYIGMGRGKL